MNNLSRIEAKSGLYSPLMFFMVTEALYSILKEHLLLNSGS